MAKPKDQDEEAKVRFLLEAVGGTYWKLRAAARVMDRKSYQSHISALNTSLCELAIRDAAKENGGACGPVSLQKIDLER